MIGMASDVRPNLRDGTGISSMFDAEWKFINRQRLNIFILRSALQQSRNMLRQAGDSKAATDDKLFQAVRRQQCGSLSMKLDDGHVSESLADLIEDSQKARDDYGPLDHECIELETKLYGKESQLYRLEALFFSKWTVIPSLRVERPYSTNMQGECSSPTRSESEDHESLDRSSPTQNHPLTEKFLRELGDLDLLREQVDDMMEEKELLEEQRETRKLVGLDLGLEAQSWLADSSLALASLYQRMRATELEVKELRRECLARQLVDEFDNPREFQWQVQHISSQEDGVDPGSQVSVYVKFPILIMQPGIEPNETKQQQSPQRDDTYNPTMSRINEWLLQKVRSSPLDVVLLASIFDQDCGSFSGRLDEQRQLQVLRFWYEDSTMTMAARPSTGRTSKTPRQYDHLDGILVAKARSVSP